jgi:hypothetical protein
MKNKILFIHETSFDSFHDLLYYLQEFTLNHACYPDEIQMTKEGIDKYINLMYGFMFMPPAKKEDINREKIDFRGIKIKEKSI